MAWRCSWVCRQVGLAATSSVTFDAAGNLTTQTASVTDTATVVLSYDRATNRLLNRRVGGSVTTTFAFDARGQRVRSVVTSGSLTTTTTWAYEGLTLLSLAATRGAEAWSVTYLSDDAGRAYAGLYREGTSATPFLLSTNDRGDVIALTDVSGVPFASHRYDPWGVITSSLTTATASMDASLAARIAERQPLRYAGYVHDAESRMYYCSARTYDPTTRQFLSKDPAKDDGEESAYQYCGGDPVGKVDPSGLWAIKLPGLRLYIRALTSWHSYRYLWNPGGAPSGQYLLLHTPYLVTFAVCNAYFLGSNIQTFRQALAMRASVYSSTKVSFLINSRARFKQLLRTKAAAGNRAAIRFISKKAAVDRMIRVVTRPVVHVSGNWVWTIFSTTIVVTSRGKRLRG